MKFSKEAAWVAWFEALLPGPQIAPRKEWLRASVGMGLGLFVTSLLGCWLQGAAITLAVFAPLAASAVLIFAVSSGPLAQPWSVVGSYGLAALTGAAVLLWGGSGFAYASLSAGLSLLLMYPLRCVHPPGGAVAFTVVLAAPVTQGWGFYLIWPVVSFALLLVLFGLLYNNLTGVRYPRVKTLTLQHTRDLQPLERTGVANEDLDQALEAFGEFVDVTHEDLKSIIKHAEKSMLRRHVGHIQAQHVMSKDLRWTTSDSCVEQAWRLCDKHSLHALPVVDRELRVVGLVSVLDLMRHGPKPKANLFARWRGRRTVRIKQLMQAPTSSVTPNTDLVELIQILNREGVHSLPVLEQGRLVGIITQTDLIAALQRYLIEQITTSR